MEPPGGRDSRFNLGYSMNLLSGETPPEIYGNPGLGRPSTSLQQLSPRHTMVSSACGGRGLKSDVCYDDRGMSSQGMGLEACGVNDISEETYNSLQSKKSPPSNGKKTKGRVKIKMEYIENKLRRYTTFSKRKTGIMKKAYELSTLTGTQVMLLVASETGHVYTFATRKLQPMITSEAGKALIQTCLNSPDPPAGSAGGDQRMSATGFEETELTYNISDEDSKIESEDSSSSDSDLYVADDNSDLPEAVHVPPDPLFPPTITEKVLYRYPITTSSSSSTSTVVTSNVQSLCTHTNVSREGSSSTGLSEPLGDLDIDIGTKQSELPPKARARDTVQHSDTIKNTVDEGNASNSKTRPVAGLESGIRTEQSVSLQAQATPLVVQTPAGIGYATLPNGMILGMVQGLPNSRQPQLIAIPLDSVPPNFITTTATNKNNGSETKQ